MNPLLHPFFIHIPLAVALILPFLSGFALFNYRKNPENLKSFWPFVVIPVLFMSVFLMLSLSSGEEAIELLEHVMSEEPLEEHEEIAEIFAMLGYIVSLLAIFVLFMKEQVRSVLMIIVFVGSIALAGLGLATGKSGGKIVHQHFSPEILHKAIHSTQGQTGEMHEHPEENSK